MTNKNIDPNNKKNVSNRDARKSKNLNKDSDYKLELANSIARNSKRVVRTYAQIENTVIYFFRWISGAIDKFLFNQKFGKYAALILAIVLYVATNSDLQSVNLMAVSGGAQIDDIPIQIIMNPDAFEIEIEGNLEYASASVVGDVSEIQMLKSQKAYKVVADLTGYSEGTHNIDLVPVDFSNKVNVNLNPSSIVVTIKKKTTGSFKITHEYINTNKMDSIYALDENPILDKTEVFVKASQDTLDKIAYVKALIDATGITEDFEVVAPLVAYDQSGRKIDVEIFPSQVKATVKVTTPMKTVPIVIKPIGELPNGNAIDSITVDHTSVTIYGPNAVLADLNEIVVEIEASKIDKDTNWTHPIVVPSGVTKVSVSKINIGVKIGKATTKVFDRVRLHYKGDINAYELSNYDTWVSVTVTGTQANLDKITQEDITPYIDVSKIKPGVNQELPLVITGSNNLLIYRSTDGRDTITVTVKLKD